MKVDGFNGLAPLRHNPPPPRDHTSSSPAGGAGVASGNGFNTPVPLPPSSSTTPVAGYSLAGRLSLGMHFAVAQSYSSTVSQKAADGYRELRATVEQSFEADYQFDMTFMAQLDAASQKMGGLGGDTLGQFVDAASKLSSLSEDDLRNFVNSVDKLFGELKGVLGDNLALDGAKELLKGSVTDFIHMVKGEMDNMASIASQGGPGAYLTADAPTDGAAQPAAGGIDFQKLYDETTKKFDSAFADFLQNLMADAQKTMAEFQQSFLDELKNQNALWEEPGKQNGPTPLAGKPADKNNSSQNAA